jgi:hypothetical protein
LKGVFYAALWQMKYKPFWICLVTKNNFDTVVKTITSIIELADMYSDHTIHLMVLDKSEDHRLKLWIGKNWSSTVIYEDLETIENRDFKNDELYMRLGYDLSRDSIQRARLQLLLASQQYRDQLRDTIVWQIDDDMLFANAERLGKEIVPVVGRNFFEEVQAYHARYPQVDAAVGTYSNVPPLPILLYFEKQLVDLVAGEKAAPSSGSNHDFYHDLYGKGTIPESPNGRLKVPDKQVFEKMLRGVSVTRPILSGDKGPDPGSIQPSILRGGNYIIFNPEVLWSLPHIAMYFDGIISRRSDMIQAWMSQNAGYQIMAINLSLFHYREFQEVDLEKICLEYLRDALGAVAFRFLKKPDTAWRRYEAHLEHLGELRKILGRPEFVGLEILQQLRDQLKTTQTRLSKWKEMGMQEALESFQKLVIKESALHGVRTVPR